MLVTVKPGKRQVIVLNFGEYPITKEERNDAVIPNKFLVRVRSDYHEWLGSVRVDENGGQPQFAFTLDGSDKDVMIWKSNPSAAYKAAYAAYLPGDKDKLAETLNGQMLIGVTYPSLQKEIIKRFELDDEEKFHRIMKEIRGVKLHRECKRIQTSPLVKENAKKMKEELKKQMEEMKRDLNRRYIERLKEMGVEV